MSDDLRCCGSGTCIIDPEGRCWCGQQWDSRAGDQPPAKAAQPGDAAHAVLNPNAEAAGPLA